MKKIFNILLVAVFALPLLIACETDDNSNPVLKEPDTFLLNTPAFAANNVYDLKNAKSVELSCSQPDYGFPASTTYTVQVSLASEFKDATDNSKANYAVLESTFTTAKMNVVASELNSALLDLWAGANGENTPIPTDPINVYIRLKATITDSGRGVCVSNAIGLPKVLISKATSSLTPPKTMFVIGSMLNNWGVWKKMVLVSGLEGQFWTLVYFDADSEFKFGTKENEYIGMTDKRLSITDKAGAGIGGDDNIKVKNAGWYVVYIKAAVKNNDYAFSMTFYPGDVYLFGATTGDSWAYVDKWKFTAPNTKDGNFVSPAMIASGEARICVKTDVDWWRTEFTLYKGEIFYRQNEAINNNWNTDKGSDYSIQGAAGKIIQLNFTAGTGELK